jgi:small subunit ribosomal protein S20
MANLKSSIKDIRRTKTRTLRNKQIISSLKTSLKKAQTSKQENDYVLAYKKIDSATAKGKIHKNKANRLKSRLMKRIKKNTFSNDVKA